MSSLQPSLHTSSNDFSTSVQGEQRRRERNIEHKILVTGAGGFIGSAFTARLISEFPKADVFLLNNMNDFFD